jgi:uncharacterized membrane protein YbhN (UPF0104 family)
MERTNHMRNEQHTTKPSIGIQDAPTLYRAPILTQPASSPGEAMLSYKTRKRGKRRLQSLFNFKTLIATILGVIVLATLMSFSDIQQVWHIMEGFPIYAIGILFGLVIGRELLRIAQWHIFLNAVGIHATRREAFLSLAGGDAAQILPGGLYFQDLLISRGLHVGISEPLAATTLMIWMEITTCMLALALFGLPGIPALRPVMAVFGCGSLAILFLAHTHALNPVLNLVRRLQNKGSERHRRLFGSLLVGLEHFIGSFGTLSHPKVLLTGLALCAAYMTLTYYGFYLVCVYLGLDTIGLAQATAIYSLVLAVGDINPSPSDLGISELTGVGGFLAFHVSASAGLAVMLTFRILLLLSEELIAAFAFLAFREETKRLFRSNKKEAKK